MTVNGQNEIDQALGVGDSLQITSLDPGYTSTWEILSIKGKD
jgi:hypothetical protein